MTFVAGLRASGLIVPFVLDGPMPGEVFRAEVAQMLAPALQPGAVVCDTHTTPSPSESIVASCFEIERVRR